MNDQNTPHTKRALNTVEMIAAAVSVAILASGAIYWIIQIRGVMETLEMAYG